MKPKCNGCAKEKIMWRGIETNTFRVQKPDFQERRMGLSEWGGNQSGGLEKAAKRYYGEAWACVQEE